MSDTINFPKDFKVTENGYLEDSIQYVYFNPSQDYLKYSEDDFRCLYSVIIVYIDFLWSNSLTTLINIRMYHRCSCNSCFYIFSNMFYRKSNHIIGKDKRIQSNGVNTYELYDFRNEEAYGYVTKEEINEIINQNI